MFFLPGVTTVDNVIRSLAVYVNKFNREDGGKEKELIDNPETVY
jgi:hypothetical protein